MAERSEAWITEITQWITQYHNKRHRKLYITDDQIEDCDNKICTYIRYLLQEVERIDKRLENEIQRRENH